MMLGNPIALLAMNPIGPAITHKPIKASCVVGEVSLKVSDRVSFHSTYLNSFLPEVKHSRYLQSRDNYLLLYRPFEVGNRIKISGYEGIVISIDLRYTELDAEGDKILIPNSKLFTDPITVLH